MAEKEGKGFTRNELETNLREMDRKIFLETKLHKMFGLIDGQCA